MMNASDNKRGRRAAGSWSAPRKAGKRAGHKAVRRAAKQELNYDRV